MDSNPFKESQGIAMIPNAAFEKQCDRYMTIIKWLIIVIVILIVTFVGYVFYNSQMETVSWEQSAEASDNGTITQNGSGEITIYGSEDQTENNGPAEEDEGSERNSG